MDKQREKELLEKLEDTSGRLAVLLEMHSKTEEEHEQVLNDIERNTEQLQREFSELQQSEYSSDAAIEKARQVIEENVKQYSRGLSERVFEQRRDEQLFLVNPGTFVKIRMNPTYLDGIWHFAVASENTEIGVECAIDMLREIRKDMVPRPEEICELEAEFFNESGVLAALEEFSDKVVIVKNPHKLSLKNLREFEMVLNQERNTMLIVFVDTIENLRSIFQKHRRFFDRFSAQFTAHCYTEEELMDYAVQYFHDNGYTLERASKQQLYKEIRKMPLESAERQKNQLTARLEKIMDHAESRSIKTVLRNLFASKLDEEGRKILKTEDF